jgi:hypothetical protein
MTKRILNLKNGRAPPVLPKRRAISVLAYTGGPIIGGGAIFLAILIAAPVRPPAPPLIGATGTSESAFGCGHLTMRLLSSAKQFLWEPSPTVSGAKAQANVNVIKWRIEGQAQPGKREAFG